MKIAVLSSHTPSLFWFRIDMMCSFLSAGYDVIAIGNESENDWGRKFSELGIHYRQINVSRNGTNPLHDLKTYKSIKKVLSEEQPQKVFTYQAKTNIYGCIAAKMLGIKDVYTLVAGTGSVFMSDDLKTKIISKILVIEYRIALKNSKRIFFQNCDDSDLFVRKKILKQDKVVYICGSGVNTERFIPTPLPKVPTFLNVSRLIKDKGVLEYLEACRIVKKQHPEYRCLLVGPFDTNPSAITKEELDSYIKDGVIEYFGEQSDIRPYMEQASIFVLPSYHEGTPKTVLEAMASGRAVITTDAPGCRETVLNGRNGFLVSVKNINELVEAMLKLAADFMLVERMGKQGRSIAEDKYAVSKVNEVIMKTMEL